MPGSFPKFVQIAMSLRDTTTDEIANFRESQAKQAARFAVANLATFSRMQTEPRNSDREATECVPSVRPGGRWDRDSGSSGCWAQSAWSKPLCRRYRYPVAD